MGWNAARKHANTGGGGRYLKPEDGVTLRLMFLGEPYVIFKRWEAAEGKMYIDEDAKQGARPMYLLEVYNLANPAGVQQLEVSKAAFRSIEKELIGDPADNVVMFKRVGTGKNTKYNVISGGKPSDTDRAAAAAADADRAWSLDDVEGAQAFDDEPSGGRPSTVQGAADPDDVPF